MAVSYPILLIVLVASLTSLRCVYAFPQEKIAEEGKSRGIPEEPGQNSTNTCSPSGEETAPVNNTNQSQNESMDCNCQNLDNNTNSSPDNYKPGDKGSQGDKGSPGDKGSNGGEGSPGDKGSKGGEGSPGDKGSKGGEGSPGDKGSNGGEDEHIPIDPLCIDRNTSPEEPIPTPDGSEPRSSEEDLTGKGLCEPVPENHESRPEDECNIEPDESSPPSNGIQSSENTNQESSDSEKNETIEPLIQLCRPENSDETIKSTEEHSPPQNGSGPLSGDKDGTGDNNSGNPDPQPNNNGNGSQEILPPPSNNNTSPPDTQETDCTCGSLSE